jgi:hypothetical protein
MGAISEDAIRQRAYHIWEREGRPQGRDFEHWVRAQVELLAEATKGNSGRHAAPPSSGPSNAKAAGRKPSRAPARGSRAKKPA